MSSHGAIKLFKKYYSCHAYRLNNMMVKHSGQIVEVLVMTTTTAEDGESNKIHSNTTSTATSKTLYLSKSICVKTYSDKSQSKMYSAILKEIRTTYRAEQTSPKQTTQSCINYAKSTAAAATNTCN